MIEPESIVADLHRDGFSVIRRCFDLERIESLARDVNELYRIFDRYHVEARELRFVGRPPLHSHVFEPIHLDIVDGFLGSWKISESTSTRRIGPRDATHMPALAAHVDAFFHAFDLTLNFWTPLQACGDGVVPGLSVWKTPLADAKAVVGFNPDAPPVGNWNFSRFSDRWWRIANGFEEWEPENRVSPRFDLGDACVLTNWTVHATGPGDPSARRANVELRFQQV